MRCEGHTNVLSNDFARLLPELSVPWQAEEPIDPTLLVLNDGLAIDLGLDPEHLRSDEGIRWLLGADPEPEVSRSRSSTPGISLGVMCRGLVTGARCCSGRFVTPTGAPGTCT